MTQENTSATSDDSDLATIAWLDGAHRGKAEAARWEALAEGLADDMQRIIHHDPTARGLHFDSFEQLLASAVGIARAALATYTAAKEGK